MIHRKSGTQMISAEVPGFPWIMGQGGRRTGRRLHVIGWLSSRSLVRSGGRPWPRALVDGDELSRAHLTLPDTPRRTAPLGVAVVHAPARPVANGCAAPERDE